MKNNDCKEGIREKINYRKFFYLFPFFIILTLFTLTSKTACAMGIAVSPDRLEFSKSVLERQLNIFNPNNYTVYFRLEDEKNIFDYSFKDNSMMPNSKTTVKVRLQKDISFSGESRISVNLYFLEGKNDFNLIPAASIRAFVNSDNVPAVSYSDEDVQKENVNPILGFFITISIIVFGILSYNFIKKKHG